MMTMMMIKKKNEKVDFEKITRQEYTVWPIGPNPLPPPTSSFKQRVKRQKKTILPSKLMMGKIS